MNPVVTESPQSGYYIAYLFSHTFNTVVLSMQVGITSIQQRFGRGARAREEFVAATQYLRKMAAGRQSYFPDETIVLGADGPGTRAAFYELAHVTGKAYLLRELPGEEVLTTDLAAILDIYASIVELADPVVDAYTNPASDGPLHTTIQPDWEDTRRRRLHNTIERNPRLIARAKAALGATCQACGFNFSEFYGPELGASFIEAHHRIPLSQLLPGTRVRLNPETDFAVLCANCHRMMHRRDSPATVEELHQLLVLRGQAICGSVPH
jgi:5-methylcytosine-specific restriction protein A